MNNLGQLTAIEKDEQRRPLIVTPLVGKDRHELMAQLDEIVKKEPDVIEWRIDYVSDLHDTEGVLRLTEEIHERSANIPLLFTRRSSREGGENITLTEREVFDLYEAVVQTGFIWAIDVELSSEQADIDRMVEFGKVYGVQVLMSYHNFERTPSKQEIVQKLTEAKEQGAHIGKVAVMPTSVEDVLTLMQATQEAAAGLPIPIVTMSMGRLGALSRMMGGACGSAMTFAVGSESSAPGQIPMEELQTVLDVVERVMEE
ncbi:type I 3-dehydroquinate dehydratase [Geomicrobium sp. JCM 19055]|uniref:type I 3-dehydroquinate dehydratase n=1 Tax=Geomicrobium sp. JCM 19055 TaxID=1460649 RepID=UPI00045EDA15|nr:type I 3-dehydroquinate dehydratase [Geomicrobium sp. JCM 19055]GAJ97261.1 3-dehydroquinate dehydratase I [Geomicrobium sp. JCM 19055]